MHNRNHEYSDDCEGCQPAMLDLKTGRTLPKDHPTMIIICKAFKEQTTLSDRRAWHRVVLQNSQNDKDLEIAQKVVDIMTKALEATGGHQENAN